MTDYAQLPTSLGEVLVTAAGVQATALPVARSTWGAPDLTPSASVVRGADRARRLIDIFAEENMSGTRLAATAATATDSAAASSTTSASTLTNKSTILPLPNAGSIAGLCIGSCFILAGIAYLCCRRRRDFRGNRVARDSESGGGGEGATEVAVGGKAVATIAAQKGGPRRGRSEGTGDERRWRREIRLELEAEVVDLKKKEKEDRARADEFCGR